MRHARGALVALAIGFASLGITGPALTAEDDGRIAAVDHEAQTVTLDNGNVYNLPGEFDVESLEEGMEVAIAYDTVDGERQVTDIVFFD